MAMICGKQEHTMAENLDKICGKQEHAMAEALDNVMECYPEIPVEEIPISVEMDQEVLTQTIMRIPIRSLTESERELIHNALSKKVLTDLTAKIETEKRNSQIATLGYTCARNVPQHLFAAYIIQRKTISNKYEDALNEIYQVQYAKFPSYKDSYH